MESLGEACKSELLTPVIWPVLWKHSHITLHGGPLASFLSQLDGFHLYLNVAALCALTEQLSIREHQVSRSQCHEEEEELCFGLEMMRLICAGPLEIVWCQLVQPQVQSSHSTTRGLFLNTTEGSCFGWASVFKSTTESVSNRFIFLLFLAELLHRIQESQTMFTLRQG